MSSSRTAGLRLTRVGVGFGILWVLIVVAAANTGNNGLFLVLSVMAAAIVVSQVLGRVNLRGIEVELRAAGEIFANSPVPVDVEIRHLGRWLPRWQLVLAIDPGDVEPAIEDPRRFRSPPLFLPVLPRREHAIRRMEVLIRRRGRYRIGRLHLASLFPVGLFRKGAYLPANAELLVYPEIFSSASRPSQTGKSGDDSTRRAGWGHDLFALRSFRHGDDPRAIHWKQSARTGSLIVNEREAEESRRLMIVFDNAVGELSESADRRFERLVSEAATAALDYLNSGYEVGLLTRDTSLDFGGGPRQRAAVLETLALIEALPEASRPLVPPRPELPHMLLGMDRQGSVVREEQVA